MMEQVIEVEGYRIFTKVEGSGRPILLLHSYWGSHILFDELAKMFSATMKVIRIDLPGHGQSGIPSIGYTFEKFAPVLLGLLTRLGVTDPVSIVGHSMGGYVAMAFAAKYPEKMASLVVMHSPAKAGDVPSIKLREREGRLLMKGKREMLLQVTIPSNFAPENLVAMEKNINLIYQTSSQVTLEGALRSIQAINHRADSLGVLQRAQYPILVIVGKWDKVYDADDQLDEVRQIAAAEVLLLHHSGHLGFMEEEDLVMKKMNAFFEKKIL